MNYSREYSGRLLSSTYLPVPTLVNSDDDDFNSQDIDTWKWYTKEVPCNEFLSYSFALIDIWAGMAGDALEIRWKVDDHPFLDTTLLVRKHNGQYTEQEAITLDYRVALASIEDEADAEVLSKAVERDLNKDTWLL